MRAAKATTTREKEITRVVENCKAVITKAVGRRAVGKEVIKQLKNTKQPKTDLVGVRLKLSNLDAGDELAASFSRAKRDADVGRALKMSTSSVRAAREKVGVAGVRTVQTVLDSWHSICMTTPPVAAFHCRKYDSASFPLKNPVELPIVGHVASNCTSRPIHVQNQRRMLILVWSDKVVEVPIPVPPVPMSSTSAECNRISVDEGEQVQKFQATLQQIIETGTVLRVEADGTDGHYANLKYVAWRHSKPPTPSTRRHHRLCGNHDTALVDTHTAKTVQASKALSLLTTFVTMLRAGGFFLR